MVGAQPFVPRRLPPTTDSAFVRFAALPLGGALEWRRHWDLILATLGGVLQRPVSSVSVASEESLARALAREQVDVAFLTGRLALDAVLARRMRVVAQMACDAADAPRALLLARRADMPAELDALLAQPARWRIARGDERSLTGFVVPQAQLLLPRGLPVETAFRDERVSNHQDNLLALANGDVDLATNDSMHLACFAQQFPNEAARLRSVWQSAPVPAPMLLVREDAPEMWMHQTQAFFAETGTRPDNPAWRAAWSALQMPRGFVPADNRALLPVADLVLELGHQRARGAQWVSEDARQTRLRHLGQVHARQLDLLRTSVAHQRP
ncbi:MAG: phosphate/phosphite/phosphonate ABC transporter substrate-binding protein [Comamonadaceae bacterium]|nr:MAG: phosphate/phosphite/phosphonate ABC transporter substrate-binding protein [Comamonadaceae bacterium]